MGDYKQTRRFERTVRLSVLFLVALVFVAVLSFVRLGSARRENEKYNNLIAELEMENKKVNQSLDEMTSYDYLEQQARERLGMIKGDETYIEFK